MLQHSNPDSPWLRLGDMCQLFDVNPRTIWKWTAEGKLPRPYQNGRRWTRWMKTEVDAALKSLRGGEVTNVVS